MVLKIGHFENRSEMPVLKCGAGKGWSSDGSIVREMKMYYTDSRKKGIPYIH
jgi:hypothetical protein